jgi:hypothetical protein
MKKLLLITGALVALTASSAFAAGQIHLAFGDCGSFGTSALNNTCTNAGAVSIFGSVVPPGPINQFVAMEGIVDASQSGVLSDWWRGDAAGCRNGKMSGSFNFLALFNCTDPWAGAALGSLFVIYPGTGSTLIPANSERFDIYCAVGTETPIDNTQEYYMFNISIAKSGTVGGCAGCNTPTSLYFNDLVLGQTAGAPGGNSDLSGDGAGQSCGYNGGNQPTPTSSKSWGSIKALYR